MLNRPQPLGAVGSGQTTSYDFIAAKIKIEKSAVPRVSLACLPDQEVSWLSPGHLSAHAPCKETVFRVQDMIERTLSTCQEN